MKPLTLKVAGLRSYRQEIEVDFTDVALMAIVGDTGAGKSSLLEAITFALYGGSTWSGHAGDLIADNAKTMKVELVFLADGQRWKATRAMSRDHYPLPVHRLECLDVPGKRTDGRDEVNKQIERLLGLDRGAFLRSVILPQGRFAELLQASKTDRTKILRNIFRVDELEYAQAEAIRLLNQHKPALVAMEVRRSTLLEDPAAAEAEAARQLEQATQHRHDLDQLHRRLDTLAGQIRDDELAAKTLGELHSQLSQPRYEGLATQLQSLEKAARALGNERSALEAKRQQATGDLQGYEAALRQADEAGEGLAALASAQTQLQILAGELPGLGRDLVAFHKAYAELGTQAEHVREAAQQAQEAATLAQEADQEAERRGQGAQTAADAVEQARAQLTGARTAHTERERARKRVTVQDAECTELESGWRKAQEAVPKTDEALEQARARLTAAQRAEAAAHAAEGLHAGDPCPVCTRGLPEGFIPPQAPSLDEARGAATEAEQVANTARAEAASAKAAYEAARRQLDGSRQELVDRQEELADKLTNLGRLLHGDAAAVDDASLGHGDDELLAALVKARGQARALHEAADGHARALQSRATAAMQQVKADEGTLESRTQDLHKQREQLQKRLSVLRERATGLPSFCRPEFPSVQALLDGTTDLSVALNPSHVEPLVQAVITRLGHLRDLEKTRSQLQGTLDELNEDLRRLHERQRDDIDRPVGDLRGILGVLYEHATQTAQRLSEQTPPAPPDGHDLPALTAWASDLQTAATDLAAAAHTAAGESTSRIQAARQETDERLAAAELPHREALDAARVEAGVQQQHATDAVKEARRQAPIVKDLEQRLTTARGFMAALETVKDLLADSRFVSHVIGRRQHALLGVASQILGEITGGRFGFSTGFQVVDRHTGQPRNPKTLSGGESFLASLALALGMVELAGRAGGRLDALFLDEGFGALDANSLDAALDALESRAASGRVVAVISHVKAVAERIEHVLAVQSDTTGSKVAWLSSAERAVAVDQELTQTVNAGLLG